MKKMKKIVSMTIIMSVMLVEFGTGGIVSKGSDRASVSIPDKYQYTVTEKKIVSKAIKSKSGKKAARLINTLSGNAFKKGTEDVLDTYYSDAGSVDGKYKSFVKNINDLATKTISKYKVSAEDRLLQEKKREYWPDRISVEIDRSVDIDEFKKFTQSVAFKAGRIDTYGKNSYQAIVYLKKNQNVKEEIKKWRKYEFVDKVSKCKIDIDTIDGSEVISLFKDTNVKNISLDKSTIELKVGKSTKLSAKIKVSGNAGRKMLWECNSSSVVKVYPNGKIKALKRGTATVWVISKSNTDIFKKVKINVV